MPTMPNGNYAEHIIGLKSLEYIHDTPATHAAVRRRFEAIQRSGVLRPRSRPRHPVEDVGTMFELDWLAGDHNYVFLSYGPRYRLQRPPELCYGFVFDADQLIRERGALVGSDLLPEYELLLDGIIREIDASLPPLPAADIDEISAMLGSSDPDLLAYVREQSTSRYHDIERAVRNGDVSVEGAADAIARFKAQVGDLQRQHRVGGEAALARLEPGMEILAPGELPLSYAIGTIEVGQIYITKEAS